MDECKRSRATHQMFRRLCTRAEIQTEKAPVSRHTLGTKFYGEPKDIQLTGEVLGHSSVEAAKV